MIRYSHEGALCPPVSLCIIASAGLSNQQGRRIKHPQAVTHIGQSEPHSPTAANHGGCDSPVSGAWVGSQRKRPRCAFLCEHCFAATRSAYVALHIGTIIMIYTFLIVAQGRKLAELSRIRTISAYGRTEAEARAHLAGLPLVFAGRRPAGLEVAA